MERLQIIVTLALAASSLPAQQFEQLVTSPYIPQPTGRLAGAFDVDNDGRHDLLFSGGAGLQFYRNLGAGRFALEQTSPLPWPLRVEAAGDLDGDGLLDFVLGRRRFRNVGDGSFEQAPDLAIPFSQLTDTSLVDIDADGDLDVIAATGTVTILTNDGVGNFTDATANATANVVNSGYYTAPNDADRDGDIDLIVYASGASPALANLWRNDGSGTFAEEPIDLPQGVSLLPTLSTWDIDGDFDDDILYWGLNYPPTLMRNDGQGHYTLAALPGSAPDVTTLLASTFADWNDDGRANLITPKGIGGLASNGPLSLTPFPKGAVAFEPVILDLDNDIANRDADHTIVMNAAGGPRSTLQRWSVHNPVPATPYGIEYRQGPPASPNEQDLLLLLLRTGALPVLMSNVPSPIIDPGYRPVGVDRYTTDAFDPTAVTTDAALLTGVSAIASFVACTNTGVQLFQRRSNGLVTITPSPLPTDLGTPTHVGSGDLGGAYGDDIAFGGPGIEGVRLFLQQANASYQEQALTLPPATPNAAPAFETITIADMNGDGNEDIVHELRVAQNNGDGTFSIVAELAQLVSADAEHLLPIDHDDDGDLELLVFGANTSTQLLESTGNGFEDVTIGRLPPLGFAPTDTLTVADADGDGDLDILVTRYSSSDLLRNEGGVFHLEPHIGPRAILADVNGDHCADLLTEDGVLINRHAHLHEVHVATPGLNWELQVHAFRTTTLAPMAVVAISTAETFVQLPDIGELHIDLAQAALFPVTLSNGVGSAFFEIPLTPLVIGIDLFAQAVVVEQSRLTLTSVVRDRVR